MLLMRHEQTLLSLTKKDVNRHRSSKICESFEAQAFIICCFQMKKERTVFADDTGIRTTVGERRQKSNFGGSEEMLNLPVIFGSSSC